MLNVRLSRESLLFLQRNKMNTRGLNPSVPVDRDDIHPKMCDFGFATPVARKTRVSQRKLIQTADKIQGVTRLPNSDLHKRFSESVLYNTPSCIVEIALEEPQSEPKVSKIKVAKGKMKNSSHPLNATKTVTEEIVMGKVDKKQNSKQRIKLDAKKRSAESTQEQVAVSSELADTPTSPPLNDVSQPASKRPKVFSDWDSFSTTIESVVAFSAENVSENAESDQTSKENFEGNTVSEARTKRLARKSTVTTDVKPVKGGRKKKELEIQADRVVSGTEQSTSLLKSPMSPQKGIGKSPSRSGPIISELNDENISKKATTTDVSIESESDTCSSASGEEDPIFFRGGSSIGKRGRIGTILSDIFGTSKKTHTPSESSTSPEFDYQHKLSKSLPGLMLPLSKKQHSPYEHSANRDLNTVATEKVETRRKMLAESVRNKKSSKNAPISKSETSRISTSTSTTKKSVTNKPVENGEFTAETPHLSESVTPSIGGSPTLKRKKSTRFPRTLSPHKQDKASLNASKHDDPLIDRDSDTFDDGLILAVPESIPIQRSILSRTDESMIQSPNYRRTVSNISAQCDVVPAPAEHPTRFNLYMAPLGYPVRARQIVSTEDFLVSWLDLEPTVIFPLQTSYRTMVMRLKGIVEFRSNPFVSSRMMVNSASKMVELEAGRLFHIANTGDEVASIQMTEVLQ